MTMECWRICGGYAVWVVDGRVSRGISKDGRTTVYPYRAVPARRGGGWERRENVALGTLRTGLCSGQWRMM